MVVWEDGFIPVIGGYSTSNVFWANKIREDAKMKKKKKKKKIIILYFLFIIKI